MIQSESMSSMSSAYVFGTDDDEIELGREEHLLQSEAPWEIVITVLNLRTCSSKGSVAELGHWSVT